jgi:GT2 family glycosyltransferase/2-polyprenyl-3-methyl-5-hydroxy-6-metoxy-1,4-benzoquinol methylase
MDKQYNFSYEPVSVYAHAVDLIRKYSGEGAVHIDLGCGYAAIARQLENYGIRYIGFDANQESVETLNSNGVEAHKLDLTQEDEVVLQLKSLCESYSVVSISMLDVIEHLDFDCRLLSRIKESFSTHQKLFLILSVPNFSHIDVAVKFLSGVFEYSDTGLLDKTHKVVYTENNLSRVIRKNGWKQIDHKDYHLEFSEQFSLRQSILLNRDGGIGKELRRLKATLDPNSDVYQFVRAYVPDANVAKQHEDVYEAKNFSISLVFPDKTSAHDLLGLLAKLSSSTSRVKIDIVVPEKIIGVMRSSAENSNIRIFSYEEGLLGSYIRTSLSTRYWSFVTDSQEVCVAAFDSLFLKFDGSRGSPLVELSNEQSSLDVTSQFELFSALDMNATWRIMIPTDYARQFHDVDFVTAPEEWAEFVKRAALICGISRIGVDMTLVPGSSLLPRDRYSVISKVLSDPKVRPYFFHSDDCVEVLLGELQQKHTYQERNKILEGKIDELEKQLHEIVKGNSWILTRPLRVFRRVAARVAALAKAVVRRDIHTIKTIARPIYLKFPALKFVWSFCLNLKTRFVQGIQDKTFSHHNIDALAELSNKRFLGVAGCNLYEELYEYPEIDISVVSYNSSRWVESFFESLVSQNYPLEKINFKLVDNGSVDNTVGLFQKLIHSQGGKFSSAEVIQQQNLGFGAGHDRAIRVGKSKYCLVVNLDLEFLPDSIVQAVTAATNDPSPTTASWEFRQTPYEHPKYYDPVTLETNWSSHACVLLKREAYARCGGYDHAIFMYGEDVEFSYRLRSFGYTLKYLPSATVLHHTYEEAGEVKPLQFSGSILGNTYIRLRYGSFSDRVMAFVLYGSLFLYPSRFPGSKKMLLRNIPELFKNIPHFLKGKGTARAEFPFRGYDYELIRDGAFWKSQPVLASGSLPLVTIITRTYKGRGMFLQQAMQSVFNQTYKNIELIVAEDGGSSQRELVESMSRFSPSAMNVRFLENEKIGRSGTGNAAMAVANGQFYMFLDDDDLLFSDHVETLMQCLSSDTSIDAAYSLAFEVSTEVNDEKSFYTETLFYTPPSFRQVWDYDVLKRHNFIPIQSILFKKELYQRWGGFDLTLDQLEDWNLWLRYGHGGSFKFVEKTTSLFRTPADSSVRAERHSLLHEAYDAAKTKAEASIVSKLGGR